jgi:hypothetical protein
MTQTIDESRAQLIADLQERAEELTELNRIAIAHGCPGTFKSRNRYSALFE